MQFSDTLIGYDRASVQPLIKLLDHLKLLLYSNLYPHILPVEPKDFCASKR